MALSLQEFIATNAGQSNIGNTPDNRGQCVGLVSIWMDNFHIPHEWGHAKDLLANANPEYFTIIYNDPNDLSQYPQPGDIMVWGDTWGGGLGHTGIVVDATGKAFHSFEQNNPVGAPCSINYHANYAGVLGWMRMKVAMPGDTQAIIDDLRTARDNNWNSYQAEVAKSTILTTQLAELQGTILRLEGVIRDTTTKITKLQTEVQDITDKSAVLASQLADIHKEDSEAIELGQQAQLALKNYIADNLAVALALHSENSPKAFLLAIDNLLTQLREKDKAQEKQQAYFQWFVNLWMKVWTRK